MVISGDSLAAAAAADSGSRVKPHLVFSAVPASGHTNPALQLAAEMVKRGYPVTFIGGELYAEQIKRIGADFVKIAILATPEILAATAAIPPGVHRLAFAMEHMLVRAIPNNAGHIRDTLEQIRERDAERPIVLVHEQFYLGALPFAYGAPPPKGFDKFPKIVNINGVPLSVTSRDTAPFGLGLPPDSTPVGQTRNELLNRLMYGPEGPYGSSQRAFHEVMDKMGAKDYPRDVIWMDLAMTSFDVTLQLTVPSLEYERSDLNPRIKFAGCTPRQTFDNELEYPSWWADVQRGDKKVVAVAQGTIELNYENLVLPTIRGMADRDDVLVVALLGSKGATLPKDFELPSNARVIDFFPYDAVLQSADVWVMNGGYAGFTHGVVNGVPMVLAAHTEEKPETAMRGEWAGIAVNMRTGTPSAQEVGKAIEEVLGNSRYKTRVEEIRSETEAMGTFDLLERQILDSIQ